MLQIHLYSFHIKNGREKKTQRYSDWLLLQNAYFQMEKAPPAYRKLHVNKFPYCNI